MGLRRCPAVGQRSVQARPLGTRRRHRALAERGLLGRENIRFKKVFDPIIPADALGPRLRAGRRHQRLDWVNIPASDLHALPGRPGACRTAAASMSIQASGCCVPSNGQEPFQNDEVGLKVRQALSHAIDRERLVELTNGLATEAYCMVPPGVFGFIDDPEISRDSGVRSRRWRWSARRHAVRGRPELARDHDAHARQGGVPTTPTSWRTTSSPSSRKTWA